MHAGAATSTDPVRREGHFHAAQEIYLRKHFGGVGLAGGPRGAGRRLGACEACVLPGDDRRGGAPSPTPLPAGPGTVGGTAPRRPRARSASVRGASTSWAGGHVVELFPERLLRASARRLLPASVLLAGVALVAVVAVWR